MAGLALVWVALGFLEDQGNSSLIALELFLTGAFVAEFVARLWAAPDRRRYLRGHLVDAIALIPSVRGLRILRVLRLLRLVRTFAGVYRVAMSVERLVRHRGLAWLLVTWLAVMVVCSAALYIAERDVNELVASPFDALWWGVSTLTTVGYGDVVPRTDEGRLAAMVLMLLGIGLFSAITATVTSAILSGSRPGDAADTLERLAELRDRGAITAEEFEMKKAELLARL